MSVSKGWAALIGAAALLAAPQALAQTRVVVTPNAPKDVIQGGSAVQVAGDPSGWVTDADYPEAARAARESGEVGFAVTVDDSGMVSECRVTKSSGSKSLDSATCKLIRRRGRFIAARNADNEPVSSSWGSVVQWNLWQEFKPADDGTTT